MRYSRNGMSIGMAGAIAYERWHSRSLEALMLWLHGASQLRVHHAPLIRPRIYTDFAGLTAPAREK